MEKIVIEVSLVISVSLVFLLIRSWKSYRQLKEVETQKDQQLTEALAKNLDLEKDLKKLQDKHKKQSDKEIEINNIQKQIRALKHDMKNHSLVILSYLDKNKIDEAKEYTSQMIDQLNKIYTYIYVGNSLMNYIINNKFSKAKELNIDMKAEIENLAFEYMDSIDFSAILNNLLDNAIEAAANSKDKKIEIVIAHKRGFDTITIKNSIDQSVLETNPKLKSTKQLDSQKFFKIK